jgi:hypothetical protein
MNKKRFRLVIVASFLLFAMGLTYLWIPKAFAQAADLKIPLPAGYQFWENPNVQALYSPVQQDVENNVTAQVQNLDSTNDAINVTVSFFFLPFGVSGPLSPWQWINMSAPFNVTHGSQVWCPQTSWTPDYDGHVCLQAVINYAQDPNANNNVGQHNLQILPAAPESTIKIAFKVYAPEAGTPFTGLTLMTNATLPPDSKLTIEPPGPYDVPVNGSIDVNMTIELPPAPFYRGDHNSYNVTIRGMYANGTIYGGLTVIIDTVGGVMVPIDKVDLLAPFLGVTSTILGVTIAAATLAKRVKRRKEK